MRRRCTECGRFIWILVVCATRRSIVVRITRNATQKNLPDKTWRDSAAVTYGDSCGEWTAKPSPIDATTRTSFVHTRKQTMSRLKKPSYVRYCLDEWKNPHHRVCTLLHYTLRKCTTICTFTLCEKNNFEKIIIIINRTWIEIIRETTRAFPWV